MKARSPFKIELKGRGLRVFVSVSLYFCVFLYLFICMLVSLFLEVLLSLCLFLCVYLRFFVCLCDCVFVFVRVTVFEALSSFFYLYLS